MQVIHSIEAFYPQFSLGGEPQSVRCSLSILEANGKRYLKTPFALLNAYADDDAERQIGCGYYATEEDCLEYLRHEYPNWEKARPLMDAYCQHCRIHGEITGPGRLADKLNLSPCSNDLPLIVRGHRRFGAKRIREALAAIA